MVKRNLNQYIPTNTFLIYPHPNFPYIWRSAIPTNISESNPLLMIWLCICLPSSMPAMHVHTLPTEHENKWGWISILLLSFGGIVGRIDVMSKLEICCNCWIPYNFNALMYLFEYHSLRPISIKARLQKQRACGLHDHYFFVCIQLSVCVYGMCNVCYVFAF